MPLYRASFRHTFSSGDTVELTSKPYPANSWDHARALADAFGYEEVRIAVADFSQHGGRREYPMLTVVDQGVGEKHHCSVGLDTDIAKAPESSPYS